MTLEANERKEQSVRAERAVLVGVILPNHQIIGTRYDPLAELAGLVKAAGGDVVGRMIQKRTHVEASTFMGRGKVKELAEYIVDKEAEVIVFDNDLSPSQIREIEKVTQRRVIDRTELILDIFANRAQTAAAKLQVELAQLQYTAPRLRGMWTHLERIAGAGGGTTAGAVGGIGTRGPGESQIEIDRRLSQRRMTVLKEQLANIDRRKIREVRGRSDYFTVGLVGYTNAGKSTLMNALTGAGTYVADKLFATLDTKTRKWDLGGGQSALLSDTVGFIRNLPHHLVASFKATLEEAIHSHLLLHVVDAADPNAQEQIAAVEHVLIDLGCRETPSLIVLNKIDAIDEDSAIHILRSQLRGAVEISAKTGDGIPALVEAVRQRMRQQYREVRLEADVANGKLVAYVRRHGQILSEEYADTTMCLNVRLPAGEIARVIDLGGRIAELSGEHSSHTQDTDR